MSTLSSAERWPVVSARYTAARMPHATASPCRKRDVAGLGFERVAEGVAEIQDAAQVAFALVAGDHLAFIRTESAMMRSTASGVRASTSSLCSHQECEELGVADDAGLDDFVEAGAVLAVGQGVEHGRVDEDGERLVEAADQVLAADEVHAGLAADRGVHLGEQGGRDLEHGNAAHEDGGQEAGHVVDDAAAESDHHARAVGAALHHLLGKLLHGRQALLVFAAGKGEEFVGDPVQPGCKLSCPGGARRPPW